MTAQMSIINFMPSILIIIGIDFFIGLVIYIFTMKYKSPSFLTIGRIKRLPLFVNIFGVLTVYTYGLGLFIYQYLYPHNLWGNVVEYKLQFYWSIGAIIAIMFLIIARIWSLYPSINLKQSSINNAHANAFTVLLVLAIAGFIFNIFAMPSTF